MDKDRKKGKIKQLEGILLKAQGNLTDSTSNKVKGSAKQAEGQIQEQYGKAKDSVRKAINKAP
jgi:uncharacterized protein YjbJ (UPF0337 family)